MIHSGSPLLKSTLWQVDSSFRPQVCGAARRVVCGSFVHVQKRHSDYPLQSYFRLNAQGAGQFEHTLIIVEEGADLHFIEGCPHQILCSNLHAGVVELFVKDGALSALLDHRKLVQEHVHQHQALLLLLAAMQRWSGSRAL